MPPAEPVQENPVSQPAPVPSAPVQQPEISSPAPSGSFPKVVVLVLIVLLLVGVGAFIAMQKSVSTLPESQPTTQNTNPKPQVPAVTTIEDEAQIVDDGLTALDRDLAAIDTGLNDKQGDLSE